VALWVARASLRAIRRITPCPPPPVLPCLDCAGQDAAAVSPAGMRGGPGTAAPLADFWTFVTHNRPPCNRTIPARAVLPGAGGLAQGPALGGWSLLAPMTAARQRLRQAWRPGRPALLAAPLVLTTDQGPASIDARIAHSRMPAPPRRRGGSGRPRHPPRRVLAPALREAQLDKPREGGGVVGGWRRLRVGATAVSTELRGDQRRQPSAGARDHRPSRQRHGRVVRTQGRLPRSTLADTSPVSQQRRYARVGVPSRP
jgi:hypothetical protein